MAKKIILIVILLQLLLSLIPITTASNSFSWYRSIEVNSATTLSFSWNRSIIVDSPPSGNKTSTGNFSWFRSITVDALPTGNKTFIDDFSWIRNITVKQSGAFEISSFSWKRKIYMDYYTYTNWSNWWVMTVQNISNTTSISPFSWNRSITVDISSDNPIISNPNPVNNSVDIDITLSQLSVDITDPNGDSMNWTIETSPDIGSSSGNNEGNGTKTCSISGLQYSTTYTWYVNATDGGNWTNKTYYFTTRNQYIPNPPTSFTSTSVSSTQINLSWDRDTLADTTYIERNTVSSWNRGDGTFIYNGTGTNYSDTGLTPYTTYYYRAWSYNDTDNVYSTTSNLTSNTTTNNIPQISNEYPSNSSTNIPIQPNCHITIYDADNDTVTIKFYENTTGSWVLRQTNITSNTVNHPIIYWNYTQANSYNTTYYWKVSVNDTYNTTTAIYHFMTIPQIGLPVVYTNESTGVEEYNATLNGYLSDDGGENCTVGFEWGTTTSYTSNITNYNPATHVNTVIYSFVGSNNGYKISFESKLTPSITITVNTIKVNIHSTTGNAYNFTVDIYIANEGPDYTPREEIKVKSDWNPTWTTGEQIIYLDTSYTLIGGQTYSINFVTNNITSGDNHLNIDAQSSCGHIYHAYLDSSENFVYGTDSNLCPDISLYYTVSTGDNFSYNLTSLTPGQLYHYRAFATNSNGTSYGNDTTFLTKPLPPSGLTYTSYNHSHIQLTWTKGSGANNTVIRRSSSGYPTLTTGTLVYNGSASSYDDTTITPSTKYYYSAWSYTSWDSLHQYSDNTSSFNITIPPQPPQNITYNLVSSGTKANLTINWTIGIGANRTVIRKASGGPPDTPNDGLLVYNDTGNGTIDIDIDQAWYYRLWSYNTSTGLYSEGVDLSWYGIWLNCYNETNGQPISNWSVLISNSDGTQSYMAENCNNSHILNTSEIPHGSNIIFKFSATGYNFRIYHYTILEDHSYTIDAYLPPIEYTTPGGGGSSGDNTTTSILCLISVVDESGQPIPNTLVEIKKYVNSTDTYQLVGSQYTDGNGQTSVYLLENQLYLFNLSKNGYIQIGSKYWIPTSEIYIKTFMMQHTTPSYDNETSYSDSITFTARLNSNGSITIYYNDLLNKTINTTIIVKTNTSLIDTNTTSNTSSFTYTIIGVNTSLEYYVILYLNHSVFGSITDIRILLPLNNTITNTSSFNNKWTPLFGPNPFGWSSIIGFFILIVGVFSFGKRNAGISLILTGGVMLFLGCIIGITMLDTSLSILFIIVGFLVQWRNHKLEVGV